MAHPTISIEKEPSLICATPAYNDVSYCFKSSSYQTATGTKATFSIELKATSLNIMPAQANFFTVAGVLLGVGAVNNYNTVDTSATYSKLEMSYHLKDMFEANNFFFQNYTFEIVGESIVGTARNFGIQNNFTFDFINWFNVGANVMLVSFLNGTVDEYLPNYRIVVQIWTCVDGVPIDQVSQEAYQVDENGEVCINIGRKVAPLLDTTFVHNLPTNVAYYKDEAVIKDYCIRYGELYGSDLSVCTTELRTFVVADEIRIYNGAFQRDEVIDKNAVFCDIIEQKNKPEFRTNTPDLTELCEDSIAYLWIDMKDVVDLPMNHHPYWYIYYTDGTLDVLKGTQLTVSGIPESKCYAIAAGGLQMKSFANPAKKIDYWRVRMLSETVPLPLDRICASQYFKMVSCCEGNVEFIFLNEYGGYDTVLFSRVDAIEFQSSNAVFESFLDASMENALNGGQDIVDLNNNDVYTVTSKFVNDYKSIAWIKEFLNSPKKYIRASVDGQEKKINKVLVQVDGVEYAKTKDNSIYLRLQYRINEYLNHQEN